MNEKGSLPTAPLDAQTYNPPPPQNYAYNMNQTPPPPYSQYPQEFKSSDPNAPNVAPMYPPIGLQPSPNESQPMMQPPMQPPVAQPMVQPMVQQVIQVTPPRLAALGPQSVRLCCPHCQADMSTSITKDPSIAAYVSAGVLCFLGCFWGCCLIPFCMDSCKNTEHHCAHCKRFIGRYSRY